MTLFKTTIWQTLAIYTNTFNQSDRLDTFSRVVFIFFFIFFTIHIQRHYGVPYLQHSVVTMSQ